MSSAKRKTLLIIAILLVLLAITAFTNKKAFTSFIRSSSYLHQSKAGMAVQELPWTETETGNAAMISYLSKVYDAVNTPQCRFMNTTIANAMLAKPVPEKDEEKFMYYFELVAQLINCGRMNEALMYIDKMEAEIDMTSIDKKLAAKWYPAKGIAYLRYGEVQNCIENHNSESCIFPLSAAGQHQDKLGAGEAILAYENALRQNPNDLASLWLLNIAHMQLGTYPDKIPAKWRIQPEELRSEYETPAFRNIASLLGVDYNDMCGGVIMDDFNHDGLIDIFQCGWGLKEQVHYLENDGNGHFTDKTLAAGLKNYPGGLMINQADYNNDGHLDIFILRGAWFGAMGVIPNSLLRNNGNGTFTDVTRETGLFSCHPTQTATWADFNNDGWIDLFIGNEASRKGDDARNDCELYLNNKGVFTEVAAAAGANINSFVKGVASGDYDNDGDPDIYISANGFNNYLLRNDTRRGSMVLQFTDMTEFAGVTGPKKSFPCVFFDFNNDGWLDILNFSYSADVSDADIPAEYLKLPRSGNMTALYINNKNGTFTDAAQQFGLDKTFLVMGCNIGDFDMDGWMDFYVGTGKPSLRSIIPNRMFRNNQGLGFQEVTSSARVGHLQKGHSISFADLNNDGFPEIFAQMGGAYEADGFQDALYENPASWNNHWVSIDFEGRKTNKKAIGVRVEVVVEENGQQKSYFDWVQSGASFGANSLRLEIGLGKAERIKHINIYWPGSNTSIRLNHVPMDKHIAVTEGEVTWKVLNLPVFDFPEGQGEHHHHL
jgi:tetratricopeptide (TPR) repeat protein